MNSNLNQGGLYGREILIPENPVSRFLFVSTRSAWIWLIIRIYVGYEWLSAGWGKLHSDTWTGAKAGTAIQGFVKGALTKSSGDHADVAGWYASFLQNAVLPNAKAFSYVVAYGEVLVGLGLILGLLTGIAAFFGSIMNVSYLFAGTVSTNPLLLVLATWLVLAWKVAGWYGLDRWALPKLGTPWQHHPRQGGSKEQPPIGG
ncbi:DoxX family membrane protein [Paenibacillus thalictri]|uniref:DoxX family membrane protein n=1 Tax=Paenibacillus thalictri TaxID=2527873 RepID=A0A4Q9DP52_9BACL|nr:DoxX family membrane protein [Paenibacillus thalictri]TBL77257.1 DoxX family membrane protein [Paenibacillus thalictri]